MGNSVQGSLTLEVVTILVSEIYMSCVELLETTFVEDWGPRDIELLA